MAQSLHFKKIASLTADSSAKLKKLWKPLRRFLFFSLADEGIAPQKNISVSIERGMLSVVYASRFLSRISVHGIKEYTFEEDKYPQPEELASSLSLAVNEFGAARGVQITLGLPKAWTVVRTAEFPSAVKENISNVVSYEMDRLTPFTSEESFFDFRVLKDTGERLTLLVMAARADAVKPYISALKENGFKVAGVTSRLSGMGVLCRNLDKKADTLYIEIGEKGYEGALFTEGGLAHIFSSEFPGEDEEARVEAVSADLKSQTVTAKNEAGDPQVVVHFKGGSRTLKDLFKSRLTMPFKIIEDADIGIRLPEYRQAKPFSAIANAMQSLAPKSGNLNLLNMGTREERKVPMGLTVILICGLLAVWLVSMFTPVTAEEKRLAKIDSLIAAKKEDVRKVEAVKKSIDALQKEVATIENFKEGRPMTLNILKELTTILPASAWLTRVRIAEKTVDIEGYASSATELLSKLEASKLLKKAEFASPTFRDARMNSDRFVIKMEMETAEQSEEGGKNAAK
jgi:general secretion pathway protein L